ncbi:MAG: Flp pilus assembly complex ATPase component TadA [Planctomycetaceae bacterium]|nr:Flp pilus assembly complex ATPase component TadA [Planctomycetaceae bacterium]
MPATTLMSVFASGIASLNPERDDFVPRLVDWILQSAREHRASDVHLVPDEHRLVMRWRIDGVLQTVAAFEGDLKQRIIARLKVISGLLTYRTDVPQEGRVSVTGTSIGHASAGVDSNAQSSGKTSLSLAALRRLRAPRGEPSTASSQMTSTTVPGTTVSGNTTDEAASPEVVAGEVRVTTFPTLFGEKAAIRLFADHSRFLQVDDLGLPDDIRERLQELLQQTSGVILLTGPSGSGKTTILHCIAGLQSPNQGQISLGAHHLFDQATHRDIAPQKRHITLVSQEKLLFPHLRVRQNIMYGWRHLSEAQKHLQPEEIARILHIEHLLDRFPSTLSGGEQQRVAIARAIAAHPKLLLLDEPTSHLDPANAQRLLLLLQHLQQRLALPILLTSHDQAFIQAIATKTYRLSQGKLEEVDESAKAPKDGSLGGRSKEEGNSTEEEKP